MANLGERVAAERERLELTQEELAKRVSRAGFKIGQQGIAQIERRGDTQPRCIVELAEALEVNLDWLKHSRGPKQRVPGQQGSFRGASLSSAEGPVPIPTRGEVAAGQWLDLDAEQDYRQLQQHPITADPSYPTQAQYGLIVRGTSMNRVAAEGTVLHCLDLGIAAVEPINDDIVIVERRRADGQQREVTAKRIRRDGDTIILAPDSTEPKWKPIRFKTTKPPEDVTVSVVALVIGFYQPLRGRRL